MDLMHGSWPTKLLCITIDPVWKDSLDKLRSGLMCLLKLVSQFTYANESSAPLCLLALVGSFSLSLNHQHWVAALLAAIPGSLAH